MIMDRFWLKSGTRIASWSQYVLTKHHFWPGPGRPVGEGSGFKDGEETADIHVAHTKST